MRRPIIAGNWKMHKTVERAINLTGELVELISDVDDVDVVICPPFTALDAVLDITAGTKIDVGAQNMHWETEGAFTGEVSPLMIKQMGCNYVIIGHSERREYFAETNENVNKKVKSAFKFSLIPIVCVGEKLEHREQGVTNQVIEKQVKEGLANLEPEQVAKLVVAYEPVWAIGTGKTASNQDAQQAIKFIRENIANMYGNDLAEKVRILYGGSVRPDNISGLMQEKDIDGALVGGASLEAKSFAEIVKF